MVINRAAAGWRHDIAIAIGGWFQNMRIKAHVKRKGFAI
jgi:hypothetical protein